MKITVYTKALSYCAQCVVTKRKLDEVGLPYEEIAVDQDADVADRLRAEGYLATPVVEVTGPGVVESAWVGYRPDLIAELAKEAAE